MTFYDVGENVRRPRATVNLSRSLGCHRTTYNRRLNKMRAALMKKYGFLSFSKFANESTIKEVKTEISCNESTSTDTPSASNINQRLSDNSGCTVVNLCSQKFVNRKELINHFIMYIMSNTSLSIRDADRVLYGLRYFIPDIPKSVRSVLKTCPSVQPKFIGSGNDIHLQRCDQPDDNCAVLKSKITNEFDSLQSAKDVLLAMQILESHRRNTSTDENKLPQNSEKPERSVH
ncbi:unnamed protein product [Schistosoma bovis]|nr:unnamed protein product [Schistosoma bovis]